MAVLHGEPGTTDDLYRVQAGRLRDPAQWLFSACSLERAADLTWAQYEDSRAEIRVISNDDPKRSTIAMDALYLRPTAFMLYGLSIENLLKSLLVDKHRDAFDEKKILASHELHKLAPAAGLAPSDDDADLLKKLSIYIAWAGRYPGPWTSHLRRDWPMEPIAPGTFIAGYELTWAHKEPLKGLIGVIKRKIRGFSWGNILDG